MSMDQFLAQIEAAKDDPTRLALITLDAVLASREQAVLRPVLEAAAIPHWFDSNLLACCVETDCKLSNDTFGQLCALPMVEQFTARGGMNIHARMRLALGRHLQCTDPERFHRLSIRAASCFEGELPHLRIETLYHLLVAAPQQGADTLRQLYKQWNAAGRHESLQSLAVALEELLRSASLAPIARVQSILRYCLIRDESLPAQQTEILCREAQAVLTDSDNKPDLGDCLALIGLALHRQGRLAEALEQYRSQMNLCDAEVRRHPDNADWRHDLSVSHNCVGGVLQAQGRLAEALAEYEADKRIIQGLTARHPDNAGWRRDLSVSHNCVGGVLQTQGRLAEALADYEAGKRIMQELTARDPDNAGWRHDLSVSHKRVGGVFEAQGRLAEALAEYEAYKRIMEELTARDPDNADWRRGLSVSHNCVGGVLQAQGRLAEALAEYEAGKRIMQELTARDPDNADWRRDLSVSHNCVGGVLQAQGRLAEALAEYRIAETILVVLTSALPDQAGWVEELVSIRSRIAAAETLRSNGDQLGPLGRP
jgi:tetratricopeptide (TPR) repeat protein